MKNLKDTIRAIVHDAIDMDALADALREVLADELDYDQIAADLAGYIDADSVAVDVLTDAL